MLETRKEFYEEEEMSLYDIVSILNRYKKKMLMIIAVGVVISFALALVVRMFRERDAYQDYAIRYGNLENDYYYQLIELNYVKFDPNDILNVDKYINRFLAVPELKKAFDDYKSDNPQLESFEKKEFINKVIKVWNDEKTGYSRLIVTLKNDAQIAPELIDIYFSILQEEIPDRITNLLIQTKEQALVTNFNAKTHLNEIKEQLGNITNTNGFKAKSIEDLDFLVGLKYPLLISDKNLYQGIYAKTSRQITGSDVVLRQGKINHMIERRGTVVLEKSKSQAIAVLLIGTFLSIFLAFLYVIASEMKNGYKHYLEKTKAIEKK